MKQKNQLHTNNGHLQIVAATQISNNFLRQCYRYKINKKTRSPHKEIPIEFTATGNRLTEPRVQSRT